MMIENIFIIQRKPKTLKQARKVKSTFTVHGLISTHGVKLLKTKISNLPLRDARTATPPNYQAQPEALRAGCAERGE